MTTIGKPCQNLFEEAATWQQGRQAGRHSNQPLLRDDQAAAQEDPRERLALSARAAAFRAKMLETTRQDALQLADGAAHAPKLLAAAEWRGTTGAPGVPESAQGDRVEAIDARWRQIEPVLGADTRELAEKGVRVKLGPDESARGIQEIELSLNAGEVRVVLHRDCSGGTIDLSAVATELAQRLARRFPGRRVGIIEAPESHQQANGSLSVLGDIFRRAGHAA